MPVTASPGANARVTHLEKFGAFVDLGCGVTSLVPLENISAARIPHPSARFRVGQDILVLVVGVDREACRFYLSHKELLGLTGRKSKGRVNNASFRRFRR